MVEVAEGVAAEAVVEAGVVPWGLGAGPSVEDTSGVASGFGLEADESGGCLLLRCRGLSRFCSGSDCLSSWGRMVGLFDSPARR